VAHFFRDSSVVFPRNMFITQLCQLKSHFVQVLKTIIYCCVTFILTAQYVPV